MLSQIGNNTEKTINEFISKIISNAELKIRAFA
jgi:hypothetical protein